MNNLILYLKRLWWKITGDDDQDRIHKDIDFMDRRAVDKAHVDNGDCGD